MTTDPFDDISVAREQEIADGTPDPTPEATIRRAIRHRVSCPAAASLWPGECVCGLDEAVAALGELVAERDEARRDWQMYVHEVGAESARADAAEMASECVKAKMRVLSLEAELSGLSDPDANVAGKHQRPGAAAETQRLTALIAYPRTGTARRGVLEYLVSRGEFGATDEEIQDALAMNPSTERPRRVELVEGGWVHDGGARRLTSSGSPAVVWELTRKAKVMLG